MERLTGKGIVLTGAGAGIGQGMARRFVAEGGCLLGVDRSAEGLAATAAQVAGPGRFVPLVADVTDAGLPSAIVQALAAQGWAYDVLCNNAGIGGGGMADACSDDDFQRYLDINLKSLFRLSREAVKDRKSVV